MALLGCVELTCATMIQSLVPIGFQQPTLFTVLQAIDAIWDDSGNQRLCLHESLILPGES